MRKSKLIIAAACMMACSHSAKAAVTSFGSFEDSSAIVIAKAVKLGQALSSAQGVKASVAAGANNSVAGGAKEKPTTSD